MNTRRTIPPYWHIVIFISAFLLFQIQPLIGKYILPWFGGGPAVWTTSLLFFQVLLLGGYTYAYLISKLKPQTQGKLHLALSLCTLLVIVALFFVWETPVTPGKSWRPPSSASPTWYVLRLLIVSVGLPYFLLSTTSSLVQSWFSRIHHGRSPYPFYAVSNVASFFALVSYPFLFEPLMSLRGQGTSWSLVYIVYVLVLGYCAIRIIKGGAGAEKGREPRAAKGSKGKRKRYSGPIRPSLPPDEPPNWKAYLLWVGLAACASVMLLATTNQTTQDVAAVPFLWVLPLSLYLLSFVICFNDRIERFRDWYILLMLIALFLGWRNVETLIHIRGIAFPITMYSVVLFACCVFFHGELYLRRPHPRYLTSFYLMLSIGGAVGGVFVSLIAPLIFKGFWEYQLGLVLCAVALIVILLTKKGSWLYRLRFPFAAIAAVLAVLLCMHPIKIQSEAVEMVRNFYGVIRVRQETTAEGILVNQLIHGPTLHGMQATSGPERQNPTAYFTEKSGIGLVLTHHPNRLSGQPLRMGIVGLGIGTLASYGEEGDSIRYYEIDPDVVRVANNSEYFTYLSDAKAQVDIVLGDGRLSLERELEENGSQHYDLLVLDVFSGGAMPVHFLTQEAFEIYLSHLDDDGILAFNITNKHVDVAPVTKALKTHYGLYGIVVRSTRDASLSQSASWVLLTSDAQFLEYLEYLATAVGTTVYEFQYIPSVRLWTDDYSNLFQVLR